MECRFALGVDRLSSLRRSVFGPSRSARPRTVRTFAAEGSRQPWEFGRFLKTVLFFNDPLQSLLKNFTKPAEKPSAPAVVEERSGGITKVFGPMESPSSPIVLFGSESEIGRCMLEGMMKKGMSVRAVVANAQQSQSDLGNLVHDPASILDLVEWNRGMPMPPAVARPKAIAVCGALAPYAKIVQSMVRPGKDVYNPSEGIEHMTWGPLDDVVMGGCSQSSLTVQQGKGNTAEYAAVFSGNITSANNGGFASVRTKNLEPPLDLKEYDGLKLRVRGDGQRYKFMLRTTENWDSISFCQSFDTKEGWQDIALPFKDFFPVFRAKSVNPAPSLNLDRISSLQIMLSKFEYDGKLNPAVKMGRFELPIESITTFVDEAKAPRVLCIGEGGGDEENSLKNMTDQCCIIHIDAEQEVPMQGSTLVAFGMACLTAEGAAKATFKEKKRSIPTENLTFDALAENFSRE